MKPRSSTGAPAPTAAPPPRQTSALRNRETEEHPMAETPQNLKSEWGSLTSSEFQSNEKWWPDALNLRMLHQRHPGSSPFGDGFDYRATVANIDIDELTRDVDALMTDSQPWWPADWGHYGPFFIRMSWHAAGTYRVVDGRGGGGHRRPALRPAELVAGQRQPRQGAPTAAADQEEVGQGDLVGRPVRVRRQPGAGDDGLQDVRLLVRSGGHLGARGRHLLGPRERVAGHPGRALHRQLGGRQPHARQPARRGPDGADLRQPAGSRTASPTRCGPPRTSARRSAGWP